tara:strand:- start:1758 stop:2540 length:783 start_codon:yes stop_codon:yes gene_type:complete
MIIDKIILYFILIIVFYLFYNKKENMSNTDIKKIISDIYKADVESIRNLSKIANDLTNKDKVVVPGNLEIKGGLNILPKGCIVAWNGTTAPAGWAMCDGKNGTPDLRGRFIRMATLNLPKNGNSTWTYHKYKVSRKSGIDQSLDTHKRGSSDAYIQNHKFNEKGGSDWRSLDIREMPSHKHSMNAAGNHNHNLNRIIYKHNRSFKGSNDNDHVLKHIPGTAWVWHTNTAGNHTHSINHSGNNWGHGIAAPYYVLVYIMKL